MFTFKYPWYIMLWLMSRLVKIDVNQFRAGILWEKKEQKHGQTTYHNRTLTHNLYSNSPRSQRTTFEAIGPGSSELIDDCHFPCILSQLRIWVLPDHDQMEKAKYVPQTNHVGWPASYKPACSFLVPTTSN